jgi:hypothetical protein
LKRMHFFLSSVLGTVLSLSGLFAAAHPSTAQAQTVQKDYENHPNRAAIEYVVKNKLMWLYPDGNFRPEQPVTQADLVAGLVNAKALTIGTEVTGLPANHWAKVYYERAKKDGILDGVTLNPSKVLNREEAALLMNNAWKNIFKAYQNKRQVYSDIAVTSGWLPKKSGKFVTGVSTTAYDGLGNVSRGEEAVALYLLHNDAIGTKAAENIALQFHNSLKVSGGNLKGKVPTVKGKDIRLLIQFQNGKIVSYFSGDFMVNASQVKFMEFTVKNSGESKSLARYTYDSGTNLIRKNTR